MSIETVLELFREILIAYANNLELQGSHPKAQSPAFEDCANNYDHLDIIKGIHSLSDMYVSSCLDLGLGIQESILLTRTITPFVNCRSLLEYASLQIWLISEGEGFLERLKKMYSIRYNGFMEQRKLIQDINEIKNIEKRMNYVVNQAKIFNIGLVFNNKGDKIGLGYKYPNSTELAKKSLNLELSYRTFSAIVHGQYWAIQQSSFEKRLENENFYLLPSINDENKFFCIYAALLAIQKTVKNHYNYMGYDSTSLIKAIAPLKSEILSHTPPPSPLT